MSTVHFVVPEGVDDPQQPSGGNVYDRRIRDGLRTIGWSLHEHAIPGSWPYPDATAGAALGEMLAGLANGAVVLLDGLIASAAADVLTAQGCRLRLVILLHIPLGDGPPAADSRLVRAAERAVLASATAVVVTSAWTRAWLRDQYALEPGRLHVVTPGVDAADLATGSATGGELLCVAAVTPLKGHDVLLAALRTVGDLPWRCTCVGSLTRDPLFVERVQRAAAAAGMAERVRYSGPRHGLDLANDYARADVLVLASRRESFGMVVTEALARGLPVIATAVGGIPEALGHGANGEVPGLLVPPDAPSALGAALRTWLQDGHLRARLHGVAGERRATLADWSATVAQVARVLTEAAA